ncbi:hypothetical protein [Methylocystis sp. S23]|jgi:hypothetical protein
MSSLLETGRWTAVAVALLSTSGARAEVFNVCSVLPTPDGFVALRDSPSPSGRLVARMHPDEVVVIDMARGAPVRSSGWLRVSHFPGAAFPNPGDPEFAKVRRGWAKDKLVDECG